MEAKEIGSQGARFTSETIMEWVIATEPLPPGHIQERCMGIDTPILVSALSLARRVEKERRDAITTHDRARSRQSICWIICKKLVKAENQERKDELIESIAELIRESQKDGVEAPTSRERLVAIQSRINLLNVEIGRRAKKSKTKAFLEASLLEKEAAKNRKSEAEYAALLAEGRKKQTLQQAHANGDFIPVDENNQVYLPSSTGKRLGARP